MAMSLEKREKLKDTIWRKIQVGKKYRIWRKDFNGHTFYNICVSQKQYDGTSKKYYVPVNFKKGVEISNETDIIIKAGIENIRDIPYIPENKKTYYPCLSYIITDFEKVENQKVTEEEALSEFRDNLSDIEAGDYGF